MGQPGRGDSVADRLAAAATATLVGRAAERARLTELLAPEGPAAVFVHGPGGIGKTMLVTGTFQVHSREVRPCVDRTACAATMSS